MAFIKSYNRLRMRMGLGRKRTSANRYNQLEGKEWLSYVKKHKRRSKVKKAAMFSLPVLAGLAAVWYFVINKK